MTKKLGQRGLAVVLLVLVAVGGLVAATVSSVGAAPNQWPQQVVNGFSTPTGRGYWLAYANGAVTTNGDAAYDGGASGLPLNGPIVGGAVVPRGSGYWLVAMDGGIFTYGTAHFYGSMGATRLNQPVFSVAATTSGHGYWLVARDGGIFTFGDAKFYGSTGGLQLNQPINGITTSPSGKGYRLLARDGGVFSFGDVPFYGSLPGMGIEVSDVVGMAPTPTDKGYWIVRSNGDTYAFGDAKSFGNFAALPSDPVSAIFANPNRQGYRLVTLSGTTVPFGASPGVTPPPTEFGTTYGFLVPAHWKERPLSDPGHGPISTAYFLAPNRPDEIVYVVSGGETGVVYNSDGSVNLRGALNLVCDGSIFSSVNKNLATSYAIGPDAAGFECAATLRPGLEVSGVVIVDPTRTSFTWETLEIGVTPSWRSLVEPILNSFATSTQ